MNSLSAIARTETMKKLFLTAFAGTIFSGYAVAGGLVNETGSNPFAGDKQSGGLVQGAAKPQTSQFSVIGASERAQPIKDGFGRDLTLVEAIGQIVPRDYSIRNFGGGDTQKYSWRGGSDWVSILREMARDEPGLQIEVDHEQRIVTARGSTIQTPTATMNSRVWDIRTADGTVSRALRRWGEEGGYQVIWESPKDFPVMATATFSGKFEDALKAVIESLANTDSPVMATYYINNVVHIVRYNGQTADLGVK